MTKSSPFPKKKNPTKRSSSTKTSESEFNPKRNTSTKPAFGKPASEQRPPFSASKRSEEKPEASTSRKSPFRRNRLATKRTESKLMPVVAPKKPQAETMRLNRFIASSGICSRRRADELIILHKVKVNGKLVTELGIQVKPFSDQITVEGKIVSLTQRYLYLVLNKPRDLISTVKDERDRKTVMSLITANERVYPIGRLDRQTTGVLLFTNDGELTARLTHPKYQIPRVYQVVLDKPLKRVDAETIAKGGVNLGDGDITSPVELDLSTRDAKDVIITLREGKYHEVRRLFDAVGYEVVKLDRVVFAGITHKGMKRGETRPLSQREVRSLKRSVGLE